VGRSADPAPIELSSRLFGAGPINYEQRTTNNKQRLPAGKNQPNAQVLTVKFQKSKIFLITLLTTT